MNNKKVLYIVLGVVLLVLLLGSVAVVSGAVTYLLVQNKPFKAIAAEPVTISNDEGILVACVDPDSPADQAGISRGDIIVEINGKEVPGDGELFEIMQDAEVNDTLEMVVQHGDERREVNDTLGERDGMPYLGINNCMRAFGPQMLGPQAFGGHMYIDPFAQAGAMVVEVVPDSPADDAGLEPRDRILSINGEKLTGKNSLSDMIAEYQSGDEVVLEVQSPGEKPREIRVTLGNNPQDESKPFLGIKYRPIPQAKFEGRVMPDEKFPGMPSPDEFHRNFPIDPRFFFDWDTKVFPPEGMPFGEDIPFNFEFPDNIQDIVDQAVVIVSVAKDSPAEAAGLQPGMLIVEINSEQFNDVDGFVETIQSFKPGDKITLTVYTFGEAETETMDVKLGKNPDNLNQAYLGVSVASHRKAQLKKFDGQDLEKILPLRPLKKLPFRGRIPGLPNLDELPGFLQELLGGSDA